MRGNEWQIGLFGTFDVENFGDLLFPLVAEAELSKRLGPVKLHPFSYRLALRSHLRDGAAAEDQQPGWNAHRRRLHNPIR